MNKEINEAINAVRAASNNIITAIDNIEINTTEVINLVNVVRYIHEQSAIIYNYLNNNILSYINVVDTEYEINRDFSMSIGYIYHSTKTYDTLLNSCDYDNISPLKMLKSHANALRENTVLLSEIKTTYDL